MYLTQAVCCLGDEVLLQQMLFDAVVTAPLEAYWNALMLNDRWDGIAGTRQLRAQVPT